MRVDKRLRHKLATYWTGYCKEWVRCIIALIYERHHSSDIHYIEVHVQPLNWLNAHTIFNSSLRRGCTPSGISYAEWIHCYTW